MKIRSKVFIIFTAFNVFWLLLAMGLMQHMAKKDFEFYLHNKQAHYLEAFANFLTAQDTWTNVLAKPRLLHKYQQQFDAQGPSKGRRPPKLLLLGGDKRPIKGGKKIVKDAASVALPAQAGITTYLAIKPRKSLYDKADRRFIKQLKQNFLVLTISLIIATAIASLVISRQLLKPIMAISKACEALKNKQWDYRIRSKGQDELAVLARNLDNLAAVLQATETQQQTWLASTSHELKTPLAILQAEIEAMQDGVRSLDASRLVSLMQEVQQLQKLVDDLQASSQQLLTFDFEPLIPAAIIEMQLQKFATQFAEKNITVECQLDNKLALQGDSRRLQQLFSNLLQNSLFYTNNGGCLIISMKETAKHIEIVWQDSAPNVSDEELSQLFDYFYRGESSRNRETGGLGLGLAIVKTIVTGHGGTITAENNTLGGISFYISFDKLI